MFLIKKQCHAYFKTLCHEFLKVLRHTSLCLTACAREWRIASPGVQLHAYKTHRQLGPFPSLTVRLCTEMGFGCSLFLDCCTHLGYPDISGGPHVTCKHLVKTLCWKLKTSVLHCNGHSHKIFSDKYEVHLKVRLAFLAKGCWYLSLTTNTIFSFWIGLDYIFKVSMCDTKLCFSNIQDNKKDYLTL